MGASFKQLVVWQRAVELSVVTYHLTSAFPKVEQFGLTNQMRRAAVSVASNIAEGNGRSTTGDYIHFLGHARGSVCELQTQLLISEALQFGTEESRAKVLQLSDEVSRMLNVLMEKLRGKRQASQNPKL